MMLLDYYICLFHKLLSTLRNLIKMIKDIQLLKRYNKVWKKLKN